MKSKLAKALQERFNEGVAADTYKVSVTNVRSAEQTSETEIEDQLNATRDATTRRRARLSHMDSRAHTLTSTLTELHAGLLVAQIPAAVGVPSLSLSTAQSVMPTEVSSMIPAEVLTKMPTEVSSMTPAEMLKELPNTARTESPIQIPTAMLTTKMPSVLHRHSDLSGVSLEDLPLGAPPPPRPI